jgi:hypothetical protein
MICPSCGYKNRAGVLFCEECGKSLRNSGDATLPTKKLEDGANDLVAKATWGTAHFTQTSTMVLHVREGGEPMVLQQPSKRMIVGRSDTTSPIKPDIDLSQYGALEKGVSRQHAAIERSEDTILLVDLGSSNGTMLNGQKLLPNQPRVLRDGDEIRLGKLVTHIYFK